MAVTTPNAANHAGLADLASRYVDVAALPWVPTRFKGVDIKVLMEDKETGLLTALTRFAPGAELPASRARRDRAELRSAGLAGRRRRGGHGRQLRVATGRQPA